VVPDELAAMESAEEIFAWLGQAYDPAVLRVHRVRILKRFGRELRALGEPGGDHQQRRRTCAALLHRIYQEVASASAPGELPVPRGPRLFALRRPSRAA
jgi:hypothetical protein